MYAGIQSSIWSNRFRTTLLVIFFPIILVIAIYLVFVIIWDSTPLESTINTFIILGPILLIWLIISFIFHKQLLFKFSGAKEVTRKSDPEIYNIVENLCISRGLTTPNIWIIEDQWMNAFAVWWNPEHSWIVFTRWLIQKLNKNEIEAVAAHELTHIMNKDNLLMTVIVIFIWAISTIWYILFRSLIFTNAGGGRDGRAKLILFLIWLVLIILWSIIYPIMKFAVSRKREYLADAWAVELTKDKNSMINALQKIAWKPQVNSLEDDNIANMCIEDPVQSQKISGIKKSLHKLFSTHPPIEDRIKALESY